MLKRFFKASKSSAKSQSTPVVVLDIGTVNVKALVVQFKHGVIEVLGLGRARQGLNDMQAGAIADIEAVITNCNRALSRAEKQAGLSAERVVVGLAGELIKGITVNLRFKRPDSSQHLDQLELDRLIRQAQSQALDQARQDVALETGNSEVELNLVNSALVAMSIDGHQVTNPIGFQGREISIQLYTAFAPLVHTGAIERVVNQLNLDLIAVAAEPFAVARSLIGDDSQASLNAILIDIGGGTTDIAVLRDGGLEGTRMFSIGGRSLTQSIARALDTDFETAEQMKLDLSTDKLPAKAKKAVLKALEPTMAVWLKGIYVSLAEFDWLDYLPDKLLLCGGGASLRPLRQALDGKTWQADLPFSKIPAVKLISAQAVWSFVDKTDQVKDHTLITALGLARVAHDTLATGDFRGQLQNKINKVLDN